MSPPKHDQREVEYNRSVWYWKPPVKALTLITMLSLMPPAWADRTLSTCAGIIAAPSHPVTELDLPSQTQQKLRKGKIKTILDLARKTHGQLEVEVELHGWEISLLRNALQTYGLGFGETAYSAFVVRSQLLTAEERKRLKVSTLPLPQKLREQLIKKNLKTVGDLVTAQCEEIASSADEIDRLVHVVELLYAMGLEQEDLEDSDLYSQVMQYTSLPQPLASEEQQAAKTNLSVSDLIALAQASLPTDDALLRVHPFLVIQAIGWERFEELRAAWRSEKKNVLLWSALRGTQVGHRALEELHTKQDTVIKGASVQVLDLCKRAKTGLSRRGIRTVGQLLSQIQDNPRLFYHEGSQFHTDIAFKLTYLGFEAIAKKMERKTTAP